jgi:hypothetical protein
MARFAVLVSLVTLLVALPALAQTAPVSDPQALSLAAKSIATMTGGKPVGDITLGGNVIWIAGSDYFTGTGTLRAKGTSESRIDLDLGDSTRSEIRTTSNGVPQGAWIKAEPATVDNAAPQPIALHNCWTDAGWFFPVLSSLGLTSNAYFTFSYVGLEQHAGVSAQHVRVSQVSALDSKGLLNVQRLSTMDFYFDPASLLPLAIAFKVHADDDMNTDIPMEIRFANYQPVSGVQVPFHIQRMLNGGVVLDVVVTSASINSGLQDGNFNIH